MRLYKIDSKSKIRVLDIYTEGSDLIQCSGLESGSLVTHRKRCLGKNIGKTNETTAEEQALSEMESKIKEKLSEGYFKTKTECLSQKVILPMLAKSYNDEKDKIDWNNCYVQPKLDGQRCLAFCKSDGSIKLISRDGKEIQNMQHIIKVLSNIKQDVILDGELYLHGYSFQENMKAIKKYRSGVTEQIKYNVYDLVSNESFIKRFNLANSLIYSLKVKCIYIPNLKCIDILYTSKINSIEELNTSHLVNLKDGFEGSIIRWGNEGYKSNSRSSNLLKYKDFLDIALPIVDITPNEANPKQGTPHVNYKGVSVKCGVKMSHSDREDLLFNKHKYIGKMAEIRYFQETDCGSLRFPVLVGIRNDK